MTKRAAYHVADFRDPAAEVARLRSQAAVVASAEERTLDALGFPREGLVLDLGCGPGFVAARLRASRPDLRIVGVDTDRATLREAPVLRVVAAADRLPFASAVFSAAFARLVLRHVPEPERSVRELARVVMPRGRVLLADSDDGTVAVHPEPDGFARVLAARSQTYARRGGEPRMARRLFHLLVDAGLCEVQAEPLVVSSALIGPAAFAAVVLAPLVDVVDEDLMPRAEVDDVAAAVRRWGQRRDVFGMTTAVVAGGVKP